MTLDRWPGINDYLVELFKLTLCKEFQRGVPLILYVPCKFSDVYLHIEDYTILGP